MQSLELLSPQGMPDSDNTYSAEDFDGYSAAPLLLLGAERDQSLIDRQDALHDSFAVAIHGELQKYNAKDTTVAFAIQSIISRMRQREGMNGISYMHRKNCNPDLKIAPELPETTVLEACSRAQNGTGTPLENHLARLAFGMKSIELANLTLIGEFRKQLEPRMWDDISEITGKDAAPNSAGMYRVEILGFEDEAHFFTSRHTRSMRIGMKREIGHTIDGSHVKARTTAIISTRPSSGFDQSLIERFKSMNEDADGKPYKSAEDARRAMAKLPEFQAAVAWLVDSRLSEGLVLARNETVYAHESGNHEG